MLKLLSITNFAVVHQVTVEFGDGLNLLTGETGSGKSIVVDALGLLVGGRASADIVRTGTSAAFVEGVFQVERNDAIRDLLAAAGIELEDGEIIVRREISDRSRSRAFVNDRLATIALLKAMRPFLVDIHGQGDQQTLLDPESHVDLLDEFGGLVEKRASVAAVYAKMAEVRQELRDLQVSDAERLRDLDVLQFQAEEIERAALVEGEEEKLNNEHMILVNAEKLIQLSAEAYDALYEGEVAILRALTQVERRVESLGRYDARFQPYIEAVQNSRYTLEDLAYFLRDYGQQIDFSPERLRVVEDRLAEIDRLKRKYGPSIAEILGNLEAMRGRLAQLEGSEEVMRDLSAALAAHKKAYIKAASQLGALRRSAARQLEERVTAELAELAMEDTIFQVAFADRASDDESAFRATGVDEVEFLVSTNVGEEPRPLARIASGGEISRLMLALKTVSAPPEIPRTLVFDEVDVGIGGRVAEAVGQRLARLSRGNQVICVTHQAQVARFADAHFSVRKSVVGDRTETEVARLDERGKVEELARMIGGADITETARRHARELLAQRP